MLADVIVRDKDAIVLMRLMLILIVLMLMLIVCNSLVSFSVTEQERGKKPCILGGGLREQRFFSCLQALWYIFREPTITKVAIPRKIFGAKLSPMCLTV